MTERLRVSTSDGKYTVIQQEEGGMRFLRHGVDWEAANRDFNGVGLILSLAYDLEEARQHQLTKEQLKFVRAVLIEASPSKRDAKGQRILQALEHVEKALKE